MATTASEKKIRRSGGAASHVHRAHLRCTRSARRRSPSSVPPAGVRLLRHGVSLRERPVRTSRIQVARVADIGDLHPWIPALLRRGGDPQDKR